MIERGTGGTGPAREVSAAVAIGEALVEAGVVKAAEAMSPSPAGAAPTVRVVHNDGEGCAITAVLMSPGGEMLARIVASAGQASDLEYLARHLPFDQ